MAEYYNQLNRSHAHIPSSKKEAKSKGHQTPTHSPSPSTANSSPTTSPYSSHSDISSLVKSDQSSTSKTHRESHSPAPGDRKRPHAPGRKRTHTGDAEALMVDEKTNNILKKIEAMEEVHHKMLLEQQKLITAIRLSQG